MGIELIYSNNLKIVPKVLKLLSVNPEYEDAPREAIRRILQSPPNQPIDHSQIESIRMGTTVATNALLERKGTSTALVITAGFRDIIEIGQQDRPDIFDLKAARPAPLYDAIVEIDERVITSRDDCHLEMENHSIEKGITGEEFIVKKVPSEKAVREKLIAIRKSKIESLAIVLLHSYAYPEHELMVESRVSIFIRTTNKDFYCPKS